MADGSNSGHHDTIIALIWDTAQVAYRTHVDNYAAEYSEAMRHWRQHKLPEEERPGFDLADLRGRVWAGCLEDARMRVLDRLALDPDQPVNGENPSMIDPVTPGLDHTNRRASP